jgi:hypothetical protein
MYRTLIPVTILLASASVGAGTVEVEATYLQEGLRGDRPVARVLVRNDASRRLRALWVSCEWRWGEGRQVQTTDIIRDIEPGRSARAEIRGPAIPRGSSVGDAQCRSRRNALYY